MNQRTAKLRELMKARGLNDAQVADMLGLKPATVRIYRCKTEESKTIPARALELLELRTASQ
jgi:transcriptional regulator with XRE-family HTH domain